MPVPEFRLAYPYPDAAVIELPRWQQPDSRTRNALIRSLRGLGERGFALHTQRWATLQNVTASPSRIGDIAKAALVLVQFEHKMIELKSLRKPQWGFLRASEAPPRTIEVRGSAGVRAGGGSSWQP